MRNRSAIGLLVAIFITPEVFSQPAYRYNYSLVPDNSRTTYSETTTEYGEWQNIGQVYNCLNWSPSTFSQGKGILFEQIATDCSQEQQRWAQDYEVNLQTGNKRKVGEIYTLNRIITTESKREAVGALERWLEIDPDFSNWVNIDALYDCTLWSPDPSVYTETKTFNQTSPDCKTDQQRQRQNREQEANTGEVRSIGGPITESQTLTEQEATRSYTVLLSAWTDASAKYGCTSWTPLASTVAKGSVFTQYSYSCFQDQYRHREETYVDHRSGDVISVEKSLESRTLSGLSDVRSAVGTKTFSPCGRPSC